MDPYASKPTRCENRVLEERVGGTSTFRARCDHCGWRSGNSFVERFLARVEGRRHSTKCSEYAPWIDIDRIKAAVREMAAQERGAR